MRSGNEKNFDRWKISLQFLYSESLIIGSQTILSQLKFSCSDFLRDVYAIVRQRCTVSILLTYRNPNSTRQLKFSHSAVSIGCPIVIDEPPPNKVKNTSTRSKTIWKLGGRGRPAWHSQDTHKLRLIKKDPTQAI